MKNKVSILVATAMLLLFCDCAIARDKKKAEPSGPQIVSQWNGKKAAYLGDSITDKNLFKGEVVKYWEVLQDMLGIEPYVYAKNGQQMKQLLDQAQDMNEEIGQDVDAIFVFAGTNDYNASVELGDFFSESVGETIVDGPTQVIRKHRSLVMSDNTFCGRINILLDYLKDNYPTKQIILLTPIHRGYAKFGEGNIQPDEFWANARGYYIDDYCQKIIEAGRVWSVPVIDLSSICGIYPTKEADSRFVRNPEKDRLHPNTEGHRRMGLSIAYQLLAYPVF